MRYSFKSKDRSLPLYIDSIGYDWEQEPIHRPHGYPYVHWLQSYSGSGTVNLQNQTIVLAPGQGLLINQAIPHDYYANQLDWKTGYFTFGGSLISEITQSLGFRDHLYLTNPEPAIFNFIQAHYQSVQNDCDVQRYGSSELVYRFLLLLKRYMMSNPHNHKAYTNIIDPILTLIREHYVDDLSNKDFVTLTNYSIQHILENFREYYGNTPHQVLMEVRINKAKEMLLNDPDKPIEDVGLAVGFNTNSYFISTFKSFEKVTPGKFRQFYR